MTDFVKVSLVALAVAGGGASVHWGTGFEPLATALPPPAAEAAAEAEALPEGDEAATIDTSALRLRPVFTPGRRPYEDRTVEVASSDDYVPAFQDVPSVHGVAIAGPKSVAVMSSSGGVMRRVGTGDAIDGWTIVSIRQNAVTLEAGGETATIYLRPPEGGGGQQPEYPESEEWEEDEEDLVMIPEDQSDVVATTEAARPSS